MKKSGFAASAAGLVLLGVPIAAYAQVWVPGSEIVGQSVQVETNGVVNTVAFDPGGAARITTPGGNVVPGTWSAANGQLCLQVSGGQECWPYQSAFQPGQQVTLVSNCNVTSRWLANSTNSQAPRGERG